MSFALFILLNGILFIRPEDFLPEIAGARLYLIVIVLCLVATLPNLLPQLSLRNLARRPITVCVLGLLGAVALSQLVRGRLDAVEDFVPEFAKVVAYYLLLIAVVDTPARLRTFLAWQVAFVAVVATLGVLQFHEVINYDALKPVFEERFNPQSGETEQIARLCGSGIFNDPNDLCLVMVFGILCCLYRGATARNWGMTGLWVLPSLLFGYALILTQSRGGLLGLLAAVGTLVWCKYGWRRALPVLALCLPAAILAIGGRQSEISVAGGTGNARIMLWAEGLGTLFRSPFLVLFGIGAGEYAGAVGQDAHNSFVHAYVDLGLLGGTLFLGAFVLAIWMMLRLRRSDRVRLPGALKTAWPFLMAMVVGYAAGIFSLSRNYIVPTYLCLGLAASYIAMAMPTPPSDFQVSSTLFKRMAITGTVGLVFLKFFTQIAGMLGM